MGAWRLLEEFEDEEFDELDELDEFAEPAEFEPPFDVEPDPAFDALPPVEALVPADDDELPEVAAVGCVEPGSTAATAPAATTLAKPTVAVVAFSLRLPRSRSNRARVTSRRDPGRSWPRGDPVRSSQLSILAVCHA